MRSLRLGSWGKRGDKEKMRKWLITVQTFQGRILIFKVKDYVDDGDFIVLEDRYGLIKKFPKAQCQIEEIGS